MHYNDSPKAPLDNLVPNYMPPFMNVLNVPLFPRDHRYVSCVRDTMISLIFNYTGK